MRLMKKSFLLVLISSCFLFGFTKSKITHFYDNFVKEEALILTGKNSSKKPIDIVPSPINLFNQQGFTLWLSPISSEASDLSTYYTDVATFCKMHGIKKVIWYFGYTNASIDFYDPTSTDQNSFIQLLKTTPLPSGCVLELRIECASMDNGPIYHSKTTPPNVPSYTTLPLYMSTRNFYNSLCWVRDIRNAAGTAIYGVTIDPQDNCDIKPDYTPYENPADADQAIVNYLDEFASINSDFYPLKRGMTFDGSAKVQIFGNRATMPITDVNLINDTNTITNFYNGRINGYAPWKRPNPAAPFLDFVYPQLYNISSDYIYSLTNQTQTAGLNFLQLLSETPYCPGTTSNGELSSITFATNSSIITGNNTQFLTELTSDINANTPIGFIDSTGSQRCVFPNNDPHYPKTPPSVACLSKVKNVIDNQHLTLNVNPSSSQSNVHWLYVENEINYREYYLTPSMVSGISLMFSAENPFFGSWTLEQFTGFMTSFYTQGQSYSLYFQDPAISSPPIPVPNQFAIFTYEQITGKSSPAPSNIWFPGE